MDSFKIKGKCVSYGTSKYGDYLEIYTSDNKSISVFLSDKLNLASLEQAIIKDIDDNKTVGATGEIKVFNDTDLVLLVATSLEI